ncbi:MAG: LysM peptidoglycan-binding domain-containing protein [Reichenbachiella sp.]
MYTISKILSIISLLIFFQTSKGASLDSLRMEKIKGKKFIVHQVDPKETLYSISKRYGSSIDEIYKYNESIEDGLKMYDELIIPYSKKKEKRITESKDKTSKNRIHIVEQSETLYSISRLYDMTVDSIKSMNRLTSESIGIGDTLNLVTKAKEVSNIPETTSQKNNKVIHTVEASETLFGIAKMYNVSVSQLTEWNELESYNLEIGTKLIVSDSIQSTKMLISDSIVQVQEEIDIDSSENKITPIDTIYVKTDNSVFKKQTKEVEGKLHITEDGFAMRIEDTDFTKKFLALHKTAPMGSLVKVKSQMTNIEIEVRVVGTLPESGLNKNVLLRLSGAAYDKLGALNLKVPVTSTYVED